MVFSSILFLSVFLPAVLLLHLLSPRAMRNGLLLFASLVFYAWGETFFVLLLLLSSLANYGFGLWIGGLRARGAPTRLPLALAVTLNLSLLGWFKYANFAVDTLNQLFGGAAGGPFHLDPVHLPIGISFFTFQAITYVVDIARGDARMSRNPLDVALYISLFPQLIAGPIVRFQTIAGELIERRTTLEDFAAGARRFTLGLAKKVLVANVMGTAADSIFAIPDEHLTPGVAWLGAVSFALQIYFDFSGYSDMAIGLGRMLGFHFPENFRYPYVAASVTEFWRRWHISLSTWFRDYLYIPLGGNRAGAARTYRNLLVVFFLCGLWHGASWPFVVWGLYHGLFLVLERFFRGRAVPVPRALRHAATLLVVLVGWVIFRAETLPQALSFLAAMAGSAAGDGLHYYVAMYTDPVFVLAFAAGVVLSMPVLPWLCGRVEAWVDAPSGAFGTARVLALEFSILLGLATLLLLSAMEIAVSSHNPFIYFRF